MNYFIGEMTFANYMLSLVIDNRDSIYVIKHVKLAIYLYFKHFLNEDDSQIDYDFVLMVRKFKDYIKYYYKYFKYNPLINERIEVSEAEIEKLNNFLEHGSYSSSKNEINTTSMVKDVADTLNEKKDNPSQGFNPSYCQPYLREWVLSQRIFEKIQNLEKETNNRKIRCAKFNTTNKKNTLFNLMANQFVLFNMKDVNETTGLEYLELHRQNIESMLFNAEELTNDLESMKHSINEIIFHKKVEKKKWLEAEYCKKTILLDVNKLIDTLNDNVIQHIQSFIEPSFIENIRIKGIQEKHFPHPVAKMQTLLNNITSHDIKTYCERNLFMLMDLIDFESNVDEYNINITNYFAHFNAFDGLDRLFLTDVLRIPRKRNLISRITDNEFLMNYYPFQRDIYVISKMIQEKNRKRR